MSNETPKGSKADRDPEDVDAVVSSLLNEHARRVIEFFQTSGEQVVSRDALVDYVHDRTETAADRDQVAIRLTHVTLPKLDDSGLIEYDHQRQTVRYRESSLSEWGSRFLTFRDETT